MTPVVSWDFDAYYAAIDRARAAWEATNPQMVLSGWTCALDGADAYAPRGAGGDEGVGLVERVPSDIPCPPRDALTSGADPCHEPPPRESRATHATFVTDTCVVSSAPSLTTTEADAKSSQTERVRLQGGQSR